MLTYADGRTDLQPEPVQSRRAPLWGLNATGPKKNILSSPCKKPNIFVRSKRNMSVLHRFSSTTPISNFAQIRPVGSALIYAGLRTEMMKVMCASGDIANTPNKRK